MDESAGTFAPGTFGELLRRFRLDRRIAQRTLAEMAGISNEAISTLERGFRRIPRGETLALLVKALALEGKDAEDLARAATAPRPPRRRDDTRLVKSLGNIVAKSPTLIGREADLGVLRSLVSRQRLVTITGAGGIGKTQVALAVVRQAGDSFPDGVWFVELAPVDTCDGILAAIRGVIPGLLPRGGDSNDALARSLANQTLLLVLDNCEHIAPSVARMVDVIGQTCPHVRILATSRAPLGASFESVYVLPALSVPEAGRVVSLEDAYRFDATRLFVERASELDSAFELTRENVSTVSEICRRLDGNALAIELAARRTDSLPLEHLLFGLNQRFRLLTGGSRTLPRQETLSASFEWSYELLDDGDKHFFRALGVFGGSFTLDAARSVALDAPHDEYVALDRLDSLVSKSLVVRLDRVGSQTRYALLETVRDFSKEKLTRDGRLDEIRLRLLRYFNGIFKAAGEAYEHEARDETLLTVANETDGRIAALDIACELGEAVLGAELLIATRFPAGKEDYLAELSIRFALELGDDHDALRSRLWTRNAYDEFTRSSDRASAAKVRAVALARASGDHRALAYALHMVASVDMRMGSLESASAALREAGNLPLSAALTQVQSNRLALLEHYAGNPDRAARRFRKIALTEHLRGNIVFEFDALFNAAESEHAAGRTEQAIELARDAEQLVGEVDRHRQARLLAIFAGYFVASNDFATARVFGLRMLSTAGEDWQCAYVVEHLALANALEGKFVRAATLFGICRKSALGLTWDERGFTEKTTAARLLDRLATMDPFERLQAEDRGSRMPRREALAFELADGI